MFNIDFKRIKFPKLIVKIDQKGWFKGLGLHHASIVAFGILLGSLLGIGGFMAAFGAGFYACKEYGPQIYPRAYFEIMDFASPLIVAIIYLAIG